MTELGRTFTSIADRHMVGVKDAFKAILEQRMRVDVGREQMIDGKITHREFSKMVDRLGALEKKKNEILSKIEDEAYLRAKFELAGVDHEKAMKEIFE